MIIRSIVSAQKWNILLALGVIYFTAMTVSCEESATDLTDTELKKNSYRKPRQDDDDEDDEITGADILNGPVVSTLSQIYAAVPEVVNMFTRFSTAVNNNLNDTDTPSIGSFLFRQGTNVVQLFQSLTGQMNQHGQGQGQDAMQFSPSIISGFNLSSLSQLKPAPLINPWPTVSPPKSSSYEPEPIPVGLADKLQQLLATRSTTPSDLDVDYNFAEEGNVVQPWPPVVVPVSPAVLEPAIETHSADINVKIKENSNIVFPSNSFGQIPDNNLNFGALPILPNIYVSTPVGMSLWNIYKSFHGRHPGDFQVILHTLQLLTASHLEEMRRQAEKNALHNVNSNGAVYQNKGNHLYRASTKQPVHASGKPNQISLWNMYNKMLTDNMTSTSKAPPLDIPVPPPSPKTITRVPTRWIVRPTTPTKITSAKPTQLVKSNVTMPTSSKPSAMIKNTILTMPITEQLNPKFTPGKPAYWMNMYYPNGIPVMIKVSTTTENLNPSTITSTPKVRTVSKRNTTMTRTRGS